MTDGDDHTEIPASAAWRGRLVWASGAALALLLWSASSAAESANPTLQAQAAETLRRATTFLRDEVAVEGSYLWRYSADLADRFGEGRAAPSQGWAQPPGTPAIGMAYLQAYAATGDRTHLEGAIEAAHALVATQLQSGGWYYSMEFDPEQRTAWCYRRPPAGCDERGNRNRNNTSIDDNTSQSALRLLMLVDRVLDGADPVIHEALDYGLNRFRRAQYPNGAWSVGSRHRAPDAAAPVVGQARYPQDWSRTFIQPSRPFYETNDNAMRDMIRTFLLAHRLYGREDYLATALRAGEFLLSAQMPAGQAGWAQTYNRDMEPVWGRKFEPPSIASRESLGVIETLLDLYLYTGDQRYMDSAAAGLGWLEASRLPEGDWARFYEMGTNRPLYMTRDYRLTYDDDDLPTHYGFRVDIPLARAQRDYRAIAAQGRERYVAGLQGRMGVEGRLSGGDGAADRERAISAIIEDLDGRGRWVDDGTIHSKQVIRHYGALARFLGTGSPIDDPARAIAAIADPLGDAPHAEVFGLTLPDAIANSGTRKGSHAIQLAPGEG